MREQRASIRVYSVCVYTRAPTEQRDNRAPLNVQSDIQTITVKSQRPGDENSASINGRSAIRKRYACLTHPQPDAPVYTIFNMFDVDLHKDPGYIIEI